jgi:single-strand DNA-binding protein
MNEVFLTGNLGKDAEVVTLPGGKILSNLSLATTESYKDKEGNWQNNTIWHNITVYRDCSSLKKGDKVFIKGKINVKEWIDANNQKHFKHGIIVSGPDSKIYKLAKSEDGNQKDDSKDTFKSDDLPF